MTVSEMLERISSRELSEWMVFYRLEPFGTEIELYGHAMTTATLINVNRKKGSATVEPVDVMPKFKPPQTVNDMVNFAEMLTAAYGGKDLRDVND